jgi:ATP/maltotriose-dependent transcriptional regulator MalT
MSHGFRYEPTTAQHRRVVGRSRLTHLLNGRFTHRVTTIVGAAGYGKTTALAPAVDSNRLDPLGIDAWISVIHDNGPDEFMAGIAALMAAGDRSAARTAAAELTQTLRDTDLPLSPSTSRILEQLR